MSGFLDRARALLGIGGNAKSLSEDAWAAAGRGDSVALKDLLSRGADPNIAANRGYTPLHMAAEYGHFSAIQVLLERGADPNKLNEHGNGPLWVAVHQASLAARNSDSLKIVERLLTAGANPDHRNVHGKSPRERAADGGTELAAMFTRGV